MLQLYHRHYSIVIAVETSAIYLERRLGERFERSPAKQGAPYYFLISSLAGIVGMHLQYHILVQLTHHPQVNIQARVLLIIIASEVGEYRPGKVIPRHS